MTIVGVVCNKFYIIFSNLFYTIPLWRNGNGRPYYSMNLLTMQRWFNHSAAKLVLFQSEWKWRSCCVNGTTNIVVKIEKIRDCNSDIADFVEAKMDCMWLWYQIYQMVEHYIKDVNGSRRRRLEWTSNGEKGFESFVSWLFVMNERQRDGPNEFESEWHSGFGNSFMLNE